MSKNVKVSIIIPVYNRAELIKRCLWSCINQTMPHDDYEIIVVDDRSTDDTMRVLNKYARKYKKLISVIQLPENSGGASRPRNVGMDKASGEYIFFVDSDDTIIPETIETGYNLAVEGDCDFVIVWVRINNTWEFPQPLSGAKMLSEYRRRYARGGLHLYKTSRLRELNLRWYEGLMGGEDSLFKTSFVIRVPDFKWNILWDMEYYIFDETKTSIHSSLKLNTFYQAVIEQIVNPIIIDPTSLKKEQLDFFEASFSIALSWLHKGDFRKLIRDEAAVKQISAALQESVRELKYDHAFPERTKLLIDAFVGNNQFQLQQLTGDVPTIFENCVTMAKYLTALRTVSNRYALLIAVKDTFGNHIDKDMQKLLSDIGISTSLVVASNNDGRHPFVCIIDEGRLVWEKLGQRATKEDFVCLLGGAKVKMSSAPFDMDNSCSIVIDGIDFAMNKRGINLVIFDKYSGTVIDSVAFDTFKKGIPVQRQAIVPV